ncbi:MAG: polyprenyl diphosphate synthase [Candidatus Micrarchaeia archaeon]
MRLKNIPKTIGLIPDGNRRWSKRNNISFFEGYQQGVNKFIDFSEWCLGYGIKNLTVWALSTENLKRKSNELSILFKIYKKTALDENIIERLRQNETRLRIIGRRELLPGDLEKALENAEAKTEGYKKNVINMLIGYGGGADILYAAKEYAKTVLDKGRVIRLSLSNFSNYLISKDIPNIDLVIRTSGEMRLSGFMPLQSAYSELYFSRKLWPDFSKMDLEKALMDYSTRERRFGN